MDAPFYRYLRGYSLDPGFSTRLETAGINEVVYRVPFEDLKPGPVGEYIEVIDFDPASDSWYEPVDLGDERIASQHGLAPSEGNPQFHQQFVYAVAMKTIRHFERALGRKIVWYPRILRPKGKANLVKDVRWPREYVQRLRIYPHAIRDANAYYDPDKTALLFGYFAAADQSQGANYPGGLVFTCLSPDIVAHEMTHAILDSIHHRYMEDTNPDVAAFHEGFADIVALLQRFTFGELVEHQLYASGGRMDRYSVLGELATQFGEALEGNRGALRSMIGKWNEKNEWVPLKPSPSDYSTNLEAHDRGAVLVATVFDAFQRIYTHRTRDLLRIATNGTGVLPEGSISRDLVHRLASETSEIAEHLLHICIRALDYCPPNDISFGSYLRALITADLDIAPEDENGYRVALIEAFRARGIFPDRVNTLSIESLRWTRPDLTPKQTATLNWVAAKLKPRIRELVEATDRKELYDRSRAAQAELNDLLKGKGAVYGPAEWELFLNQLGLTSRPVSELFGKDSSKVRFLRDDVPDNTYVPRIEVHTVRPAFRAGREGRQIEQVLITLTQRVTADVGEDGVRKRMVFRGGCSLILSLGDLNRAEYVIVKNIKSHRRFSEQAAYMNGDEAAPRRSPRPCTPMTTGSGASTSICCTDIERFRAEPPMSSKVSAKVCMYRLNELGDCFLVTFVSGSSKSRLLVDCGSFRNSDASVARLKQITGEIRKELEGKPLDVVVGTHQHNDHLSGFVHCEEIFRTIGVEQVWLSWLDDPRDRMAKRFGEAHNNLKLQLSAARDALHASLKGGSAARSVAARSLEVLDDVMGFYGAKEAGTPPELPAKAVGTLKGIGRRQPLYLRPGRTLDMPGLPPDVVRIHVLGPPRDHDLLYRKDPATGDSYDPALASAGLLATKFLNATDCGKGALSREEEEYPFNKGYKRRAAAGRSPALQEIISRYDRRADSWRRIDDDWMQQAEALALYLDTFTNNSSLVLAIELVESGKVLLFAADAQTGNWRSWQDVKWERNDVNTDALLARTVLYKVGHHASHNATLVDAFEKMGHPELVALIPVHKKDPNITKEKGWKMPARNLFKRLAQKADQRVLQMDGVNPPSCDPTRNPAKAAWKRAGIKPRITDFSVEIDIVG